MKELEAENARLRKMYFEEKLKEAIDLTSQKSSHGRTTAFETLCKVRAPFPSMTCSKTAQSLFE